MGSLFKYRFLARMLERADSFDSDDNFLFGFPAIDSEANDKSQEPKKRLAYVGGELEELSKPMSSPEVSLRDDLPPCVALALDRLLSSDCWSFLLVPEEDISRWYAVFADKLEELGRTPVNEHRYYIERLKTCVGGAVSIEGGRRFRIEDFLSFNEFGDRYSLQFFEEGRFSCDEAIIRRRDNIRLINKLKPADTLTLKNEEDIAKALHRRGLATSYLDHLCKDGLLSSDKREAITDDEGQLLEVIQSLNVSHKMAAIALADCLNVEYLEVGHVYFDKAITHLWSEQWKLEHQIFPYTVENGVVKVALADPTDDKAIEEVEKVSGYSAHIYCSAARDITNMIKKAHKDDQTSDSILQPE